MIENTFQPNWASAPGDTIRAIVAARGISQSSLENALNLRKPELAKLLLGSLPISAEVAKRLSDALGSTDRFWLERDKQYQTSLRELQSASPELTRWARSFPVGQMIKSGWLNHSTSSKAVADDLLEYFDVSNLTQWRQEYGSRIKRTNFRTSQSFDSTLASTTAWIRYGELAAERMSCGLFHKAVFRGVLDKLKDLTYEKNPRIFIPALQQACAPCGVAVVVARCSPGCAASGATIVIESGTALLLLSARFLSDDQFWFSFFHEAAHLILHTEDACVEEAGLDNTQVEIEANTLAEKLILNPVAEQELLDLTCNKFSIARFARRCGVAPGLIVGQLQHKGIISHASYNALKVRYAANDL